MKHYVAEIKEEDQHIRYTWAVLWDLHVVCYAPNEEWAKQIAEALDYAKPYKD